MGNHHSRGMYEEPLAPQALPATPATVTAVGCTSTGKQVFHSPNLGPADFSRASSADTAAALVRDRSGFSSSGCTPLTSPGGGPTIPTVTAVPITWERASKMVHAESVTVCWSLRAWLDGIEMPSREVMEKCAKESMRRAPLEQLSRVEEADTEPMSSCSSEGEENWGRCAVGRSEEEEELDCHQDDHDVKGISFDADCMMLEGCPAW
uniref:Uncharacterized protein n=1 Tax=Hemiselmis andersenii TaxID=464988 RepID=A0A6U4YVJ9_HEMAN|mmetsp:Transcript_4314/g.9825  ORF Transcript_4314/g.9825 Transcript_4314/m.9825 type:complete len:208 (-) Transcript_4314:984-1607(-)